MVNLSWLRGRFGRRVDLPKQIAMYHRVPQDVLADLLEYTGVLDAMPIKCSALKMARLEGRRDVGLRVIQHLGLTAEELYCLLKGEPIAKLREG